MMIGLIETCRIWGNNWEGFVSDGIRSVVFVTLRTQQVGWRQNGCT